MNHDSLLQMVSRASEKARWVKTSCWVKWGPELTPISTCSSFMYIVLMNCPDNGQFGGERVALRLTHNSRLQSIRFKETGTSSRWSPHSSPQGKEADTCMSICWLDLYSSRMIFFTHIIQDSLPREYWPPQCPCSSTSINLIKITPHRHAHSPAHCRQSFIETLFQGNSRLNQTHNSSQHIKSPVWKTCLWPHWGQRQKNPGGLCQPVCTSHKQAHLQTICLPHLHK